MFGAPNREYTRYYRRQREWDYQLELLGRAEAGRRRLAAIAVLALVMLALAGWVKLRAWPPQTSRSTWHFEQPASDAGLSGTGQKTTERDGQPTRQTRA